jgi:hypothetical protein
MDFLNNYFLNSCQLHHPHFKIMYFIEFSPISYCFEFLFQHVEGEGQQQNH